jgi:hypothetical protein
LILFIACPSISIPLVGTHSEQKKYRIPKKYTIYNQYNNLNIFQKENYKTKKTIEAWNIWQLMISSLGGGGRISAILFVLKWGVELILAFGMTGGVGIVP